jgi:hypothetical protein
MKRHKFRIGQDVVFFPGKLAMPALRTTYKFTRQLPPDNGENSYRIKSAGEHCERSAKESQLACKT